MAHYVAKKLHLRPSDILDHWGVCELIVAYGIYANEESMKHFYEIKELIHQSSLLDNRFLKESSKNYYCCLDPSAIP